jgi:hypothetical protein
MVNRRQQSHRAPPRRCVFCGKGGTRGNPMSEEHLWPTWMHPYLPINKEYGKHEMYGTVIDRIFRTIRKKPQMGQVFTMRIQNVVCKNCNETWMSQN